MKAMIFDMDGTLADVTSIAHHLTGDIVDSDLYHDLSADVPIVEVVRDAVMQASKDGYAILIVTYRKEKYLTQTVRFLYNNYIPFSFLYMRENGDDRSDYDFKKAILGRIRNETFVVEKAYDDNPDIIRLWEEEGIETVHITGHGFDYERL